MHLSHLRTPALLLDRAKMDANIARMNATVRNHGVALRPHLKTGKSVPVARAMTQGWSGAVTVSTLKEAEAFAAAGYRDILYAVGVAPGKLRHAAELVRAGVRLGLICDSVSAAEAVSAFAKREGVRLPTLIEIDSDGHRAGVRPGDADLLVAIGRALGPDLDGVMTHGGGSYDRRSVAGLVEHAELERIGVVTAAQTLRAVGLSCRVVSVGSTPTALFALSLAGVSEVRVGVYVFMDLVMAGLGVCAAEDIAISVLATVIGHQPGKHQLITDAGWTAMSRDRGTATHAVDQGYGLVRPVGGGDEDLIVIATTQEHGMVARRDGGAVDLARYPVGSSLRILPNHACAAAAQHDRYHLVEGDQVVGEWPRFGGW